MGYVTYDEVVAFGSLPFSQTEVEKMIEWASALVDSVTGTSFEEQTTTEDFVGDGYTKKFILSKTPVRSITSATITSPTGDTDTGTVAYFVGYSGEMWLEDVVPAGYHLTVEYKYGDLANANQAKLATIYLTRLGCKLMQMNGGAFPQQEIRLGDLQYRLSKDAEAVSILMDVKSILDGISRPKVYIIGDGGGYYENKSHF